MFRKIGEIVTGHPIPVIAVWVILLIVSAMLAPGIEDRLYYDFSAFMPEDLDSSAAEKLYDEMFPGDYKSQIVVAVRSDDGNVTKRFIDDLNRTMMNDTLINGIYDTGSVYAIHRSALAELTPGLHDGLFELYDNSSKLNKELYDALDEVSGTSRDLYYLKDNVTSINYELRKAVDEALSASAEMYTARDNVVDASAAMSMIKTGIMADPVNNSAIIADPVLMREFVVNTLMAMQGLTSDDDRQKLMAIYDLGDGPSDLAIDAFIIGIATAGMSSADMSDAIGLYSLGRDPSYSAVGSFVLDRAVKGLGQDEADIVRDAWELGRYVTNEEYDRYVLNKALKGLNETEKDTISEIYSWGPQPDDEFITRYVLSESIKGLNETESEFVLEVFGLGRNASESSLKSYAVSKAAEELNATGDLSYFFALLDMDRNISDPELESFAAGWADSNDYTSPGILPAGLINSISSGNVMMYSVMLKDKQETVNASIAVQQIRAHIREMTCSGSYPGVEAYVTGGPAFYVDSEGASNDDINNIDKVSIVLILIILGLYFRSFLTPFVPLTIIGIGAVVALGALYLISMQMSLFYMTIIFLVVIMLGAGTDYCVFILSRYAEERSKGSDVRHSVISAIEHSGKSVASSGTTAMIGFGSLLLIGDEMFGSLGIGTALGILVSILVALTLVPAMLTLAGDKVFWPGKVTDYRKKSITSGIWKKITRSVIKNAKVIMLVSVLLTIPAAYLCTQMDLGYDMVSMTPTDIDSRKGYDIIKEEFGTGSIDRAMVVATLPCELKDGGNYSIEALDRVEELSMLISGIDGIDRVYSMTRPDGLTIRYDDLGSYGLIEQEYYKEYMNGSIGKDGSTTVMYVSFNGTPYSMEANGAMDSIRESLTEYENGGTYAALGGGPAMYYDYQSTVTGKYGPVMLAVFAGIFLVLTALLRSVFTPLRLFVTLLMSMAWTLALFILVFQFWMGTTVTWILPIFLFCALMGLGVDYDIFLVSRIREEVLNGKSDEEAIECAVDATGTIITLCGAVMAAAFGSMMISTTMELKQFGFVLFLAILLDATIIRLILVPAVMVLMKKYNWWMPFLGYTNSKKK